MKILLTGASSFTGYWFAKALHGQGHQVVAALRHGLDEYKEGPRATRVRLLADVADIVTDAPFGSEAFLDIGKRGGFDLLCHHGARVGDYRSPDFDIAGALAENTFNLRTVLYGLRENGLKGVVLTGSVFEQNEGAGTMPLVAFSPYGLSKGLTADVVEHRAREVGLSFGKFVTPNPFGPLEEPRFTAHLMRCWKNGEVAKVNTPLYVRDNIHVSLLAAAYGKFTGLVGAASGNRLKLNPSGYVEAQGAFAQRYALEMRKRLNMECGVELGTQIDFSEPMMRVNMDVAQCYVEGWDEVGAWDAVAESFDATAK